MLTDECYFPFIIKLWCKQLQKIIAILLSHPNGEKYIVYPWLSKIIILSDTLAFNVPPHTNRLSHRFRFNITSNHVLLVGHLGLE